MVSIIVTHKKDTAYLRDCFDSIAEQEFKDYETIFVNDHSEDYLDDILDEYKNKINLKIYNLNEKTGVSAARNLGLEKSTGEYVYFLDSDDYIYEESIKPLLDVMDEDSDMAYGDIERSRFKKSGFIKDQADTNEQKKELERRMKFDFENPLEYRFTRFKRYNKPSVLGAIYKKSLFTNNNIMFDEKLTYFADIPVVVSLMSHAQNIKCTRDSLYVHRIHNDKEENPSLGQAPYDQSIMNYFESYKEAIANAKDNNALKNHLNVILATFFVNQFFEKIRYGKNNDWKNIYFKEMVSLLKEIDMKVINKENDFKGAEKRLIKAGRTGNFEKTRKAGKKLLIRKKIKSMFKNKRAFYKTLNLYIFKRMKEKDNWIIFESFLGRQYSGQPKYIYEYLQKHAGNKYKYMWIVNDKKLEIPGKHKKVKRFGLMNYYYMTRCKYWVSNMRQPLSMPKSKSTIMLETWHGTPLKKLVFDMEDVHTAEPSYKSHVAKQTQGWDYLLSDNPYSTERFQSCFRFDKEKILEYGYPANDPLYASDKDEKAAKIKEKLNIPKDKKVILYAPTWRDDIFYDHGQYGFNLDMDIDRLQKQFGDEYVLLLRMHYYVVEQFDLNKYGDFIVNGSTYSDVTELYLISDVLITDYSSVFFDYANLKRPILFYMYDLEKYRDVLRGFYLDINKELPGPIITNNDELVEALSNLDKVNEEYKEKSEAFYERFCSVDDGHAAERICKKVFNI